MRKIIGISGNQGSGKTTLSNQVAEYFEDVKFSPSAISESLKLLGVKKLGDFETFAQFLELQIVISEVLSKQVISLTNGITIMDRTFIDIYVYTVAQVNESAARELQSDALLSEKLDLFLSSLLELQNKHFDLVFYIDVAIAHKGSEKDLSGKLRGSLNKIYLSKMLMIQTKAVFALRNAQKSNFINCENESKKSHFEQVRGRVDLAKQDWKDRWGKIRQ